MPTHQTRVPAPRRDIGPTSRMSDCFPLSCSDCHATGNLSKLIRNFAGAWQLSACDFSRVRVAVLCKQRRRTSTHATPLTTTPHLNPLPFRRGEAAEHVAASLLQPKQLPVRFAHTCSDAARQDSPGVDRKATAIKPSICPEKMLEPQIIQTRSCFFASTATGGGEFVINRCSGFPF